VVRKPIMNRLRRVLPLIVIGSAASAICNGFIAYLGMSLGLWLPEEKLRQLLAQLPSMVIVGAITGFVASLAREKPSGRVVAIIAVLAWFMGLVTSFLISGFISIRGYQVDILIIILGSLIGALPFLIRGSLKHTS
ncbi:MAG: hypothetical protein ACRDIB_11065, partial [Ardenticatenaceae bacterium]